MPSTIENTPPTEANPPVIPSLRDQIPKLQPRKRSTPTTNPLPVPETPDLPPPPDLTSHTFQTPTRRILSPADHTLFLNSPTYKLIISFIFHLTDSVTDKPISSIPTSSLSPTTTTLLSILDQVQAIVDRSPAEDQGDSRFGNPGFKTFIDNLSTSLPSIHTQLNNLPPAATTELSTYLLESFGNRTRIDYGSGHELNFVMYLLCLYQLGLLNPADFPALVLRVFTRYLTLMRHIQKTYYLEPAGSHGVWGLDDYQFLPFLFGAAQLLHHPYIRPLSIHQRTILEESAGEYMYLGQVAFVNSVKNVEGLRWHSPMLDDISAAKSWSKVLDGMKRMFVKEVLEKLPVMQHFLFGSLIPAVEGMSREEDYGGVPGEDEAGGEGSVMKDGMRHVHQATGWGDCCGIKVPSSIAAAQEGRKRGEGLRRLPFD